MRGLSLITALGLTCLVGYFWGTRRLGLPGVRLRAAVAATLEAIGLGMLCFAVNLALILFPLLGLRAWTGKFVSIYALDLVSLVTVSLLQGLVFRWWRDHG